MARWYSSRSSALRRDRRSKRDVTRFEPAALTPADLDASRVIMIGVELPAWVGRKRLRVETWDRIPPATERYEASRDAMRDRIVSMLDALARREP